MGRGAVRDDGELFPPLFSDTIVDEDLRQALWDEGVRLFGEAEVFALVNRTRRCSFRGFSVIGREFDEDMKVALHEQGNDVYKLQSLQLESGDLYLDIGCHIGTVVLVAAKLFPDARIVCIEPVPENYFFARWNILAAKLPGPPDRVQVVNRLLGNASGRVAAHDVQTISIHDALQQYGSGLQLKVFKLDCEGCEWTSIAAVPDEDIPRLLSARLHVVWRYAPLCSAPDWRSVASACDEMDHHVCSGDNMVACCKTLDRLCRPEARTPGCRAIERTLGFSGIRCGGA